ncbi:MAG: hypothetical protein AUK50_02365 [Comamonadaceae bacterium CG2_30_57_122]|nr:MAG: hypothetical protein AUK50_02365 [Comamonadaceae bacterium CG2_30_57_122]
MNKPTDSMSAAGFPQGAKAPSGGSATREAASVEANSAGSPRRWRCTDPPPYPHPIDFDFFNFLFLAIEPQGAHHVN